MRDDFLLNAETCDIHIETLNDKSERVGIKATLNHESKKDTKSSYLPPRYNEDPDLLVLAFQELDLSTGALLYSVETTREDAWCTAALAGLGEKAEGYEKVSCVTCDVVCVSDTHFGSLHQDSSLACCS